MILSGEKKEEYREIKPYWQKRFKPFNHVIIKGTRYPYPLVNICFSNGYAKNRRQMIVELDGILFNFIGKPEWGAIEGRKYYVLQLGVVNEITKQT